MRLRPGGALAVAGAAAVIAFAARNTARQVPVTPKSFPVQVHPVATPDNTGAHATVITAPDGVQLYVRHWPAKGQQETTLLETPCHLIFMIHGYTFHSQYFAETAVHLTEAGFDVVSFDLHAHGLSGSRHGRRGYQPDVAIWVDGAQAVLEHAHKHFFPSPPAKTFIYAESMGGPLALSLIIRPSVTAVVQGVILSGAATGMPDVLPPAPVLAVVKQVARWFPLAPAPGDTAEESSWVGAFGDHEMAKHIFHHDPLIIKDPRLGMINVLLPAVSQAHKDAAKITQPMLILHGDADNRVSFKYSQDLAKAATKSKSVKLIIYEGMKHQLLQETAQNKEKVLQDILGWLHAQEDT